MFVKKTVCILASIWEIVRFFLLYRSLAVMPGVGGPMPANLLLLWFGASQLALSGGLLMLGLFPRVYGNYARLLALGKLLGLFPGILVFITGLMLTGITDPLGVSRISPLALIQPGTIVFLDLIFLLFLISLGSRNPDQPPTSRPQEE